jgi:hypothetical protein
LQDTKIDVKLKLAALWTSTMFCYVYADYFGLYKPHVLQGMLEGKMGPLGATTQGILVGTSLMMIVPSLMIVSSVALGAPLNRWLNVVLGLVYATIIALTMVGEWAFYLLFGTVEIALTLAIAWCAWRWPKSAADT